MNPAFADGGVLAEPLRRLVLTLDDTAQSHLVLATADDEAVRREAMAELAERLSGPYRVAEFDYCDAPLPSLPRYYRQMAGDEPVCLMGHGLEWLAARDAKAYGEALHFLNAHREDLSLVPGALVLWLDTPTWKDVLEKAPDFADWETGGATFALPTGQHIERTARGRLPLLEAETLRRQARHFREMLARPNLRRAMRTEFETQLEVAERRLGRIDDPRRDYRQHLMGELREHVLRGFAPQVSGRVLSLPLAKIFLPLRALEGRPALAEYAEEDLERQEETARLPELDWRSRREEMEKRRARLRRRQTVQRAFSLEGLLREPRAILLGDPGSGKTTVTRYVAWALAAEDLTHVGTAVRGRLPVLVRLANFGKALEGERDLTLLDYVATQLVRRPFGAMLREAIEAGECLVVLDGLDEVTDPDLRSDVTDCIQALVRGYAANRFLVTSRVVGYDRTPLTSDFQHATLQELSSEDRQRFVKLWYAAIRAEVPDRSLAQREAELIEALEKKPQVARMAANPLLLTIMVLMQWRGIKLPSRRVKVYEIATDTLIEYWTAERVALDAEEVKQLLAPIAHYILSSNVGGVIARRDLLPRLRDGLAEARGLAEEEAAGLGEELLVLLGEQSGIFLERGLDARGEPVYGFLHQTFGEYLAALHMASEVFGGSFDLSGYIHRGAWKEPLLLLAGHLSLVSQPHANQLLRGILDHPCPYEEILRRDALLAVECLADDVQVAAKLREEILGRFVDALRQGAPQVNEAGTDLCTSLGRTRHRAAAGAAVLAGEDPEAKVEFDSPVAMALVRLGMRDKVGSAWYDSHVARFFPLYLEGWPEKVSNLEKGECFVSIKVGPDLAQSSIEGVSAITVRQLLGNDGFNRFLESVEDGSDRSWLKALAAEPPSEEIFLELMNDADVEWSVRLLAATKLLDSGYDQAVLKTFLSQAGHEDEVAAGLIDLGLSDLIDWAHMRKLALSPYAARAHRAIRLLLRAKHFDVALPAFFVFLTSAEDDNEEDWLVSLVSDLANAEQADLAAQVGRWLALRPGYPHRYEACEALMLMGFVEETIPLLRYVAYECHGEASQKACRQLLRLQEAHAALPVLGQLAREAEPRLRYEAAFALALAGGHSDSCPGSSLVELKTKIVGERTEAFRRSARELHDAGRAAVGEAVATVPVKATMSLPGRLSLLWLFQPEALHHHTECLPTADASPCLEYHFALFEWRGGHLRRARERVTRLFASQDLEKNSYVLWHLPWTLGAEASEVLGRAARNAESSWFRDWFFLAFARFLPKGGIKILLNLSDLKESYSFPRALGSFRDPMVTALIVEAYSETDNPGRQRILEALGYIGDRAALATIFSGLQDSDDSIVGAAVTALGNFSGAVVVEALLEALVNETADVARRAENSLVESTSPEVTPLLVEAFERGDKDLQRRIIRILGKRRAAGVEDIVRIALGHDGWVHYEALRVLRQNASPLAVPDLLSQTRNPLGSIKQEAIRSLGKIDDPEARRAVLDALNDEDAEVRAEAVAALIRFPDKLRARYVLQALQDIDSRVRRAAVGILGFHCDEISTDEWLRARNDEDAGVRGIAAWALVRLEANQATESVVRLLGEENEKLRALGCWLLSNLSPIPVDALLAMLNDSEEDVRSVAVWVLGLLREPAAYSHLLILLHDPATAVRGTTAWALARYGRQEAIGPLVASVERLIEHDKGEIPSIYSDLGLVAKPRVLPLLALARLKATETLPLLLATAIPDREHIKALLLLDPESALASLDRFALPLQDESWPGWLRGHALWRLGERTKAETLFREAAASGDDVEFVLALAHVLLETGDWEAAEACLDDELARRPVPAWIDDLVDLIQAERELALLLLTRALCRKRRGNRGGALDDLAQARKLDPFATDLQELEYDHLWPHPTLDDVEEILALDEDGYDVVGPESLVAEPARPYGEP